MKIKFVSICLILLLMLSGFLGFFNSNIYAQEFTNKLPEGIETYLIYNYSDYKLYGLDYIEDLPRYNTESLTEFHMPIVYKIPLNVKLDVKKFIKQGLFVNTNKNFNDRLQDFGYTVYGDIKLDEYFVVDYWIKIKASDKPFSIDYVPIIELNNKNYKLEKYAWWNSSYLLMKQIIINHSYIDNDLVNFPVLVYSNDTTMLSKMDNGDSLRFTNVANDTEYYFEFEHFDDTSDMVVWVNITSVSSTVDTVFNMYYNNTGASDGQSITDTWDSNYIGVYHMDDLTTSSVDDSSVNANDGTKDGVNQPIESTGKIYKGQSWDGAYHIELPDTDFNIQPDLTVEAWVKSPDLATYRAIYSRCGTPSHYHTSLFRFNNNGTLTVYWENPDGTDRSLLTASEYDDDTWNYVVMAVDSLVATIYVDTSVVGHTNNIGAVIPSYTTGTKTMIGTYATYIDTNYFTGSMDEMRISDITRNASWLNASFHSQNRTTGFLTFGSEKTFMDCPDITFSNINPIHGSTTVTHFISNLSITINISSGSNFNYSIACSNSNSTSGNGVSNGTYILNVSGLESDTFYLWYVNVTHNTTCGWTNVTYNFTTKIGCGCILELTEILNEIKKTNKILEGDQIIEIETTQFVIIIQIILFCIFMWMGYIIPSLEGSTKSLHYIPFSGGLFVMFGALDFISLAILLTTNYSLGIIGGFLITIGIILLIYGVMKAFYYE